MINYTAPKNVVAFHIGWANGRGIKAQQQILVIPTQLYVCVHCIPIFTESGHVWLAIRRVRCTCLCNDLGISTWQVSASDTCTAAVITFKISIGSSFLYQQPLHSQCCNYNRHSYHKKKGEGGTRIALQHAPQWFQSVVNWLRSLHRDSNPFEDALIDWVSAVYDCRQFCTKVACTHS